MAKVVHLSLARKSTPAIMDVVQFATAPEIQFILDDYMPPVGSSARIYIKKTATEVYNDCTIDGNVVTYQPTTHSFDEAGQCVAQLQITETENVAVSFRIYVTVEPNYIDEDSIESQNEYSALSGIIQQLNTVQSELAREEEMLNSRIDTLMQSGTETKSVERIVQGSAYSTETLTWGSASKTVYTFSDVFDIVIDGQTITDYEVVEVAYTLTKSGTTTERKTGLEYSIVNGGQLSVTAHDVMSSTEDPTTYTTKLYITVAVPGISIDSDAELLDLRVGYDGTVYSTAGEATRTQVADMNNSLNTLEAAIGIAFETAYEWDNHTAKTNLDPSLKWLIICKLFDAGEKLHYIEFDTDITQEVTINIGLWGEMNSEWRQYKTITYTGTPADGKITVPLDYTLLYAGYVTFDSNIAFAKYQSSPSVSGLKAIDKTAMVLPEIHSGIRYSVVGKIVTIVNPISLVTRIMEQEIHVGEGLDFEEIQAAIDSLQTDDATIIVHPKSTPYSRFSLMRKLEDAYPWVGLSNVKNISIIGVDKSRCVIQDNSGDYNKPPAEIATNGIIQNLTFIATHSQSSGTETSGSYAVHVDNRPADANGMKLVFNNCDFVSYQTAAVGLGLYKNQDITFDKCTFKSITDISWKPNSSYDSSYMCSLGAYFMHCAGAYQGGNMFVRFRDCLIHHIGGSHSMRIVDADATQTAVLEAINNTLWDADNNVPGYSYGGRPILQEPYNHGNNAEELN